MDDETQFVLDDVDVANMTPLVTVASTPAAAVLKRQISDEESSRSPTSGAESDKRRTEINFNDLTFKDVPDGIEAPQQSAAISIPNAGNGSTADGAASTNGARRRKKRRPVDFGRPLRFDELYVPTGERLGAGAYATVATYRDCRTQREYAVKCIQKHSSSIRTRVFKEIEIFNACAGHPHVVQLIEFYETDTEFYLVFEKMNGGTLLHAIQERGHLSEAEARDVVQQIAEALSMLHKRGIAHRDLKPENILCEFAGQLNPVKIGDFDLGSDVPLPRRSHNSSTSTAGSVANRTGETGIAIMEDDEDSISTPPLLTPVGSLEYMAPEVVDTWMGEASMYDKKCDMWSLGVILYILLSGKPPFYGQCGQQCGWEEGGSCYTCQMMLCERIQRGEYEFPERDWRAVSPEAIDLVRRTLVRDPHRRASADEVLQHPWFSLPLRAARSLDTPRNLSRKTSLAGLATYTENANAWNRLIAQQHSGRGATNHYTVSCYLPSPRLDDQLTELLEVEDSAPAKPRYCAVNANGNTDGEGDNSADSIVPSIDSDLKNVAGAGAAVGVCALSSEAREEIQPSSLATGYAERTRYTAVRPRVRLPSVGGGSNLTQAARRLRFLSRSIDGSGSIAAAASANRWKRDGSPRLQFAEPASDANRPKALLAQE